MYIVHQFVYNRMYFLFVAAHAPIHIQNFAAHVEKLFANDKYGFSEEYKVIIILLHLYFKILFHTLNQ